MRSFRFFLVDRLKKLHEKKDKGFDVIHRAFIPFPGSGNQRLFKEHFRRALKDSTLAGSGFE